ncbi:MAG: hypothetical protein OK454_11240, partial [Thaumarchaeota archaeon]|nr:hypothetical protein [Nitrososphaerota archaeon]
MDARPSGASASLSPTSVWGDDGFLELDSTDSCYVLLLGWLEDDNYGRRSGDCALIIHRFSS